MIGLVPFSANIVLEKIMLTWYFTAKVNGFPRIFDEKFPQKTGI